MAGHSANQVFVDAAESSAKKVEKDLRENQQKTVKDSQKSDNSVAARKAYSRHDNLIEPDDTADISSEQLEEAKTRFYTTQVKLKKLRILSVKHDSKVDSEERMKRITASNIGTISKMRKTTKKSGKVKELLYSTFRGNQATTLMETVITFNIVILVAHASLTETSGVRGFFEDDYRMSGPGSVFPLMCQISCTIATSYRD
jgi:hypothetical protein